ncbi:hypothetical protein D3C76_1679350 [compost metagenome]
MLERKYTNSDVMGAAHDCITQGAEKGHLTDSEHFVGTDGGGIQPAEIVGVIGFFTRSAA